MENASVSWLSVNCASKLLSLKRGWWWPQFIDGWWKVQVFKVKTILWDCTFNLWVLNLSELSLIVGHTAGVHERTAWRVCKIPPTSGVTCCEGSMLSGEWNSRKTRQLFLSLLQSPRLAYIAFKLTLAVFLLLFSSVASDKKTVCFNCLLFNAYSWGQIKPIISSGLILNHLLKNIWYTEDREFKRIFQGMTCKGMGSKSWNDKEYFQSMGPVTVHSATTFSKPEEWDKAEAARS
jgi:hypothetical protein